MQLSISCDGIRNGSVQLPGSPTQLRPLASHALEHCEDADDGSKDSPSEQGFWAGGDQVVEEGLLAAPQERHRLGLHVLVVFLLEVLQEQKD